MDIQENSNQNEKKEDYRDIILTTINKILMINNSTLSNSGKIYFKIENQIIEKEENTLKIYFQLIEFLEDLLLPYFDEECFKKIEEQIDLRKKSYPKYLDIFLKHQTSELIKIKIQREQIIPKDDILGKWCHDRLEEETKETYRKVLRELLLLFKRKNELLKNI